MLTFSLPSTLICTLTKIQTGIFWHSVLRKTARAILCALRISFRHALMITFPSGADAQKNSSLMRERSLTAQTSVNYN